MQKLLVVLLLFATHLVKGLEVTIPDILNYNGKAYSVTSDPLAVLFDKYPSRKPKADLVIYGEEKHYEAEFVIVQEQLYLTAIRVIKYDSLQGNFIPVNIIREIFSCDTVDMSWLTITMVSNDGSGTRIFNFNSGKLDSTQWLRYYGDYLSYLDKYTREFKANDRITYDSLDKFYKSRGINDFKNVVELNFINIFAICSKVNTALLEAVMVNY
jgi:hypothetical protein